MINKFKKIAKGPASLKTASRGGFTLIETMIAVLLLSIAIAGPLTLAAQGLSSALISKDQIGAFYLAQDAVEYIRFARDSNCLASGSPCSSSTWLTGLVGPGLCSTDGTVACAIDSIQGTVSSATCGGGALCTTPLFYDPTDHYFCYQGGSTNCTQPTPERYVRSVQIVTPVGGNSSEAEVIVTVSWTGQGGLTHQVIVRENLFDWE
jgi:prepilin-type N-terminal cleavage/methylation domain-containing protein